MSNPVVLITGALTGIGRATAAAFAKDGATIVVVWPPGSRRQGARKPNSAASAREAAFIRADVRHEDDVRRSDRSDCSALWPASTPPYNAAGTEGRPGPVMDQTAESYAATFDTNVLGTLLSMKHELRVMQPQGHGSIVNISSTYGHEGAAGASVYAASKHAVEGMTKSAALEAGELRRARQCSGAGSDRDRDAQPLHRNRGEKAALAKSVPLGRVGEPEEIARAAVFLASEKHHSSPGKSLLPTAARPPAEGNSRSRFIDRDCAREPTITAHTRSTRNTYQVEEGVQWLTW